MAEGDDSSQEKTEEPSARKLDKAREDGQIPRSRDLTTTAILLAGTMGLYIFAGFMTEKMIGITKHNFVIPRESVFDPNASNNIMVAPRITTTLPSAFASSTNAFMEIVESPVLARAIYYTTELEQEIPSGLYVAVAQVLAYVFQLRTYRKSGGERPTVPRNLKVPKDMQFD